MIEYILKFGTIEEDKLHLLFNYLLNYYDDNDAFRASFKYSLQLIRDKGLLK